MKRVLDAEGLYFGLIVTTVHDILNYIGSRVTKHLLSQINHTSKTFTVVEMCFMMIIMSVNNNLSSNPFIG